MKRFCYALDLKDDPTLIREYEEYHRHVWPEILTSLREAGIVHAEIYRTGNRLCMILETNETFSPDRKAQLDQLNPRVQAWENLMWNYQQALPASLPGEKWVEMKKIFEL